MTTSLKKDSSVILMKPERNPVVIPSSVTIKKEANNKYIFSSATGTLTYKLHEHIAVRQEEDKLYFSLLHPKFRCQVGTARTNVSNIMIGLTAGYNKKLTLVGVGYKAKLDGAMLVLNLGKSHPDKYEIPKEVQITLPSQTEIQLNSIDKQLLGLVAANIRNFRPSKSDPYKGKGVRYADKVIVLKEVKKK
jgi:large subunit ribosomal protein L6